MLLYNGRHAKSEKVGGCCITNRSGWLLELLTELKIAIYCPQGSCTLRQQLTILHYLALSCTISHFLELSCTILHYLALTCTILHHVAPCCIMLHHDAPCCTMLHHDAPYCTTLHHLAQSCTILHPVASCCTCLLYTSPSPRDGLLSRMPSSA